MLPLDFIRNNANLFARVGSVVASYRTRGATRYGPYYRVAYRAPDDNAPSTSAAARNSPTTPAALLTQLQQPRDYRRMCQRANRQRRATLRRVIREWQQTIRAYGLDLRGCEIRGWRRLGIPRYDKTTPYTATQRAAAAIFRRPPPTPTAEPRYWQNPTPVDQHHPNSSPTPLSPACSRE
jgi:hypothetical protein